MSLLNESNYGISIDNFINKLLDLEIKINNDTSDSSIKNKKYDVFHDGFQQVIGVRDLLYQAILMNYQLTEKYFKINRILPNSVCWNEINAIIYNLFITREQESLQFLELKTVIDPVDERIFKSDILKTAIAIDFKELVEILITHPELSKKKEYNIYSLIFYWSSLYNSINTFILINSINEKFLKENKNLAIIFYKIISVYNKFTDVSDISIFKSLKCNKEELNN